MVIKLPFEIVIIIKLKSSILEINSNIIPVSWWSSVDISKQMDKYSQYDIWNHKGYNFKYENGKCIIYFPESLESDSILKRYFYILSFINDVYVNDLKNELDIWESNDLNE